MSLLPPNATALERGLEAAVAAIGGIPAPLRDLWNPATCPVELLPWLAWALSIDSWAPDWSETIKRARVRDAIAIQRRKGTAQSVRDVIAAFGGEVVLREWWQLSPAGAPHTFDLLVSLGSGIAPASSAFIDAVIAEVARTKPVRSHFTFTLGLSASAGVRLAAAARPLIFTRLTLTAPGAP